MSELGHRIRDAERRLFAQYEVSITEHLLDLEIGGSTLRVRVLETGSGRPVLLLHAAAWFAAQWSPLFRYLPDCRLIAIDFPGHGLSDAVDYRNHDKRTHYVAVLRQLLSELGIRSASLVGNSLGGAAAFWLAIDEPDLVDRFVILGVPGPVLPGMRADVGLALLSIPGLNRVLLRLPSSPEQFRKFAKDMFTADAFERIPTEMFEIQYFSSRRSQFALTLSTFVQTTLRWRSARPHVVLSDSEISAVSQPVYFIWGDNDIFGGREVAEHAVSLMKHATLAVYPGGHYPQLDDPEKCGSAIATFLSA